MKKFKLVALGLLSAFAVSCTTSYDSYGRRSQTVNPGAVAVGAVALGAIAYSVGKDRGKRKERRRNRYDDYGYSDYRGGYGHGGGYYR